MPPARSGPFIRMFDDKFGIDDVRKAVVELEIVGTDNYRLEGRSTMTEISRDPLELVKQTISEHQYPDGFVLFLGTLFAPTQDRDVKGSGFTHKDGDVVRISTPKLGVLENRVTTCKAGAALDLRHFRPDEKPHETRAFGRLSAVRLRRSPMPPRHLWDAVPGLD